tara:strand:+ start:5446 stop:6111 length:666 start_codon:yes stop_codon:yes gene_type:complete
MNIRNRAAQIRSRWLRSGFLCDLSLEELEPLFSVYLDTPKGKVVIVDKKLPITLDNLKTLSYDEYQIYKLDSKVRCQAARHHASLSRFNQPVLVSINDIYKIIRNKLYSKKKWFSPKNPNSPITIENLKLLSNSRSDYFKKLSKNADQKIIFWRKQGIEPKFTLTQLTELMEAVGYQIINSKKGIALRERIHIINSELPLTLDNLEILVNANDELRVKVST